MDAVVCVKSCQITGGQISVDYEAILADGRTLGSGTLVAFTASITQMNNDVVEGAKAAMTATYGVTFTGADRVRLFGGASV